MSDKLEYAGFWRRVGANLIDDLLITAITLPILTEYYGWSYSDSENLFPNGFLSFWLSLVFPLPAGSLDFWLSYFFPYIFVTSFWTWKQATPGKMAVSVKIIDAKTGKAPSSGQCIGRYFAYLLSFLPLGLGFLWIAFDDRKRGWHDMLCRTAVVRYQKKKYKPPVPPGDGDEQNQESRL
ncbi:RDD family protein [Candidatus Haliotispira prima]|uniref:RDD family protein n=1 Tax=Candidatus Haliotispira prima TaxID=3034016 RepID=A0ABY8MK62_9SPIO|nr:RDD family protein [Candidatus Haliotispira prima]